MNEFLKLTDLSIRISQIESVHFINEFARIKLIGGAKFEVKGDNNLEELKKQIK